MKQAALKRNILILFLFVYCAAGVFAQTQSRIDDFGDGEAAKKYVDWIEQYYIPNRPSDIEPMIIARENTDKTSPSYTNFINALKTFNNRNNTLKLRYIEFGITNNTILFNEITY